MCVLHNVCWFCLSIHVHQVLAMYCTVCASLFVIGERERANLVVQLARFFYIYIYMSVCRVVFPDFTILRSHTCYITDRKSLTVKIAPILRSSDFTTWRVRLSVMSSETSAYPEKERRLATLRERTRSRRASETAARPGSDDWHDHNCTIAYTYQS